MKFAHLADCHIGGWRDSKLKELSIKSFERAVEKCIEENVGFLLIAGDLFDNALPSIDLIKATADILNRLKEHDIDVYIIPGSHDFSPSGKTMLGVLEKAGLVINSMRIINNKLHFVTDKTNVKITGLVGLRSGLDKYYYENLDFSNIEDEPGFKIFMFHNTIDEIKPKDMEKVEGISMKKFPKNFDYYAGGHVHYIREEDYGRGKLVYPGPLFPNNFKEIEELGNGGFYIYDNSKLNYIPIKLKETLHIKINADGKTAREVEDEVLDIHSFEDRIVTIRVEGILKEGKASDINFKKIIDNISGAYAVLKNTSKLRSKEFLDYDTGEHSVEELESNDILKFVKEISFEREFVENLIKILDSEKDEGEKNVDFENRIIKDFEKLI